MKTVISVEEIAKLYKPFQRQVPYIAMRAINDTLFEARKDALKYAERGIAGGPTSWTKRALRYDKARKNWLQGTLYYAGNREYMNTILKGGVVKPKQGKRELVAPVPGKVHINKYGNLRKGKIKSLLNQPNYFRGEPPKKKGDLNARGIYREKGRGKNKKLERVVYLNLKQRTARRTYKGDTIAQKFVQRRIAANIRKAGRKAIKTMR